MDRPEFPWNEVIGRDDECMSALIANSLFEAIMYLADVIKEASER